MRKFATLAVCIIFATPAIAQSLGETTGVNAAVGITPSTRDFVTEAAESDMFEIQSSKLAQQRAQGPVKTFADRMIADHEKISGELKSLVQDGTVKATLPSGPSSSQQRMLSQLQGSQDTAAFTTEYNKEQVSAHKDAVSLFQRYADGGDNTRLKGWAGKTLPILQEHLKMAQNLGE